MYILNKLNIEALKSFKGASKTYHIGTRRARLDAYNVAEWIEGFEVDKKHANGLEVHIIDARGFIHIFNKDSKRFITILSGRPRQIKRYYEALGIRYPESIRSAMQIASIRNEETNANNF